MKHINRILLTLLFALTGLITGHAQAFEVLKDSVYTYYANKGPVAISSYQWDVQNGTVIGSNTGSSITIKWTGNLGSSSSISVTPIGNAGCSGEKITNVYKIVDQYAPTTQIAVPSVAKVYNTIPATTGNPEGGNDAGFDVNVQLFNITLAATDVVSINYIVEDNKGRNIETNNFDPGKKSGTVRLSGKYYSNATDKDIEYKINLLTVVLINGVAIKTKSPDLPKYSFKVYRSSKIKHIY
jgi:hypothetical protein